MAGPGVLHHASAARAEARAFSTAARSAWTVACSAARVVVHLVVLLAGDELPLDQLAVALAPGPSRILELGKVALEVGLGLRDLGVSLRERGLRLPERRLVLGERWLRPAGRPPRSGRWSMVKSRSPRLTSWPSVKCTCENLAGDLRTCTPTVV